jgi:hypothetical protein
LAWTVIRQSLAAILLAAVHVTAVVAMDIVAEGEATIENEDVTLARHVALRRAMVSAVEQSGGLLRASTMTTPAGIQERTSLSVRNRVLGSRIVSEHIDKGKLKLIAEVRMAGPGQPSSCNEHPLRKAVVTAFPLQLPEQLAPGEYTGWPEATADHLARVFNASGRLLGASAAQQIPFISPEAGPELARKDGVPKLVDWAKSARAQYVLAGMFRDFGTTRKLLVVPERQLLVEAFIYDGISGELIARREFTRLLIGSVRLPQTVVFGGKAFAESILGHAYLDLMSELIHWAENTIGCLPFSARVIQANGARLHLDVGSDTGLEPGMEFLLAREGDLDVTTPAGEMLGSERMPLAGVVIKSVNARYSVAEITAKKNMPAARVGDVLFGH